MHKATYAGVFIVFSHNRALIRPFLILQLLIWPLLIVYANSPPPNDNKISASPTFSYFGPQQIISADGADARSVHAAYLGKDGEPDEVVWHHNNFNEIDTVAFGPKIRDGIQVNLDEDPSSIDAEILALELSGEPLPPQELYNQLYNDLVAIREAYPCMSTIRHRGAWVPGQVLVGLTDDAWAQYQNGTYTGLDSLNTQYGAISIVSSVSTVLKIDFAQTYNPEFLSSEYSNADGVEAAQPNYYISINPSPKIEVTLPEYTFTNYYSSVGPIIYYYSHTWNFTVSESQVVFLGQSGGIVPTDECSIYLTSLPVVLNNYCIGFAGPSEDEINDTYDVANGPLCSGFVYSGDPDEYEKGQDSDYYYVDLPIDGSLSIEVTNFLAAGQVQLYYQTTANRITTVADQSSGNYAINYTGSAGRYYIRVVSPINHTTGNGNYSLQVNYP